MKNGKWYKSNNTDNGSGGIEYTGACPISISDFADSEIYSRTYLERLIENFNK